MSPTLSTFQGIVVTMYNEQGGKHHVPHVHVRYAGHKAVYDLEGNLISGNFPKKQDTLVRSWIMLREQDLITNWSLLQDGEISYKIEPLK